VFILAFSNDARVFVLASVENHHLSRLYIDVLEQLKLTVFNHNLVHSLLGKVDQFNFLQAHWTLHRRSPPVKNPTAVRQYALWHWRTAIVRCCNDFTASVSVAIADF
jgi:hypothetical protein